MLLKPSFLLVLILVSNQVLAFQCYLTLAKDSCWTNYEVTVNVINADTNDNITTITVPKGQPWARQPFDCNPSMKLMYEATFRPIFWESDKGVSYWAIRYWVLPDKINPKESAWDIPVCFPSAFSAVPFPPDAKGNCKCDFYSIPPIPPKQS